jgi:hypothetical protein
MSAWSPAFTRMTVPNLGGLLQALTLPCKKLPIVIPSKTNSRVLQLSSAQETDPHTFQDSAGDTYGDTLYRTSVLLPAT